MDKEKKLDDLLKEKNINIEEVKEDVNLFYFNSKHFGTNEMVSLNKVVEVLKNVKVKTNSS